MGKLRTKDLTIQAEKLHIMSKTIKTMNIYMFKIIAISKMKIFILKSNK